MNKKRIISLIAVLAMVCSFFSSFAVVNAEDAKTIKMAGSLSNDGKEITIVATAVNAVGGMKGFSIIFDAPAGVTQADVSATTKAADVKLSPKIVDGEFRINWANMDGGAIDFPGGELATIKIKLADPLAQNFTATLKEKAGFNDTEGFVSVKGGMVAEPVTIGKWVDPDAPDEVDPRPDKPVAPIPNPDEKPAPKPVDPDPAKKGITLTATMDSTNKVMTVVAKAINGVGGMKGFSIIFDAPAGVTQADVSATTKAADVKLSPKIVDGEFRINWANMDGGAIDFPGGELATITIKLQEALTDPFAVTLKEKAGFNDTEGFVSVKNGMTATSAIATPSGTTEERTGKLYPLSNFVHSDGAKKAKEAQDAGKTVYINVTAKRADGTPAVYGVDFVAEYPEGVELSEYDYKMLIGGYTDKDMADVINKLKFKVYSDGDVATIGTTLNAVGDEFQLVPATVDKKLISTPPPTPGKAKMSLKASSTSININSIARVTATVTDATDAKEVGENVKFKITSGGNYLEFVEKTDADGFITEALKDGAATVKVNATEKTGTAKVTAYYTYKDKNGKEQTIDQTVTITVKKQTTGGGIGRDNDGKGGAISQGTGIIGAQPGTVNFVDLDTVTWAQDAILRLVDKKVINGRSNTIFDPNGTVTRAEFAKMVVLGFGLTGGSAGNFSDVDTSAWYNRYVQVGYANDVISGYDDGTFRPNGLISRQEMAAMISRAVKAANKNLPATVAAVDFTDVNPTTEWGHAEISALQTAGVINGMTATTYEPYSNATRAQAAVIIDRAMTNAR